MTHQLPVQRIGFVHHMLYPCYATSANAHAETIARMAADDRYACMDLCLPIEKAARRRATEALRASGKQITYANHWFPGRKIPLGTKDFAERQIILDFIEREVDAAASAGADSFLFTSGSDMPEDHAGGLGRFSEVAAWLKGLLDERGMTGLIEPLDTGLDKRFLIGATADSCAFIEGNPALSGLMLEVDLGHIPCLFENIEASYRRARKLLGRVHLSSCVLRNPHDPMFGDKHPSFFHPFSQYGEAELVRALRVLDEIGYLASDRREALVFEVNPLSGEPAEDAIAAHLALLERAWQRAYN